MATQEQQYEEWLTTIVNTRLLYNTIDEYEHFMEAPSLHDNTISRRFYTLQRLRSAFYDLKHEVDEMSEGGINLERVLYHYRKAWLFYDANLRRRTRPERIALQLLSFAYSPHPQEGISPKMLQLFEQIREQQMNVPFIVLLLLKAIPGYTSVLGNAKDMDMHFDKVLRLLEEFTSGVSLFTTLPAIEAARIEPCKTRIMLLFHVSRILDAYTAYIEQANLYDYSNEAKAQAIDLQLGEFWNECQGQLQSTHFWQTERIKGEGAYFITHWHKDAEGLLKGIRYTMFLFDTGGDNIIFYLIHPESIKHRMKGLSYSDADHVWYKVERPSCDAPTQLILKRLFASTHWPSQIPLTLVSDTKAVRLYEQWFKTCAIVKPFAHLEYDFTPCIHAITRDSLYIPSRLEDVFYRVPLSAIEGLEKVSMGDNVGIMLMNGKEYLVFDEFMLYLPTTPSSLKKYGIKKVDHIE